MKTRIQKRLLVAGLFTALGLNLSAVYKGQIPIEGENLMSSTTPSITGFSDADEDTINIDGGKTKEKVVNVRGRDNESHRVTVTAKEVYLKKARKKESTVSSSGSLTDLLRTSLTTKVQPDDYDHLDTDEIQNLMAKEEKAGKDLIKAITAQVSSVEEDKLNDTQITISGKTKKYSEWAKELERIEGSIDGMQEYLDKNRKAILISYDQPEGFWCDNCRPETLGYDSDFSSSSGFISDSWTTSNTDLVQGNLLGLVSDVGKIDSAMNSVLKKMNARNDINRKAYLEYKRQIEDIKDCKRDIDFNPIRGAKNRLEACMETLEEVVEGDADFLYAFDDSDDAEDDAIGDIYSKIAPSLRKGSSKARMRKINDILDIFDVDTDGYDVMADYEGESLGVVSDLMVKKFNAESADELRDAAYDFRNARYYGPENRDLISRMESIFERNAINEYIGNRGVDRKDARLARAIGLGSVQVYCGAKTNLYPSWPSQYYDWNCRNMAEDQMNAEDILSSLGRYGDSLGFDLGTSTMGTSHLRGTGGSGLSASDILDGRNRRTALDDNSVLRNRRTRGRSRNLVDLDRRTRRDILLDDDRRRVNTRRTRRRVN